MVRLAPAAAVLAVCLAAPAAASAQFFGFRPLDEGEIVSTLDAPVVLTGGVQVEFRGDEAAGCAAAGLCDVAGTITWTPGARGQLSVVESRARGRRRTSSFLFVDPGPGGGSQTVAQVTRRLPDGSRRLCTDAGGAEAFSGLPGVAVGLDGDFLGGRCAGPQPADLRAALPVRRLERQALRARTRIDLGADAPFSAGGLTGRVRSTVAVEVLRVRRRGRPPRSDPPARRRRRTLTISYAIERVTGSVRSDLAAIEDPRRCEPLDACGLSGSLTRILDGGRGEAAVFATARRRGASRRRLRAVLGLAGGRPAPARTFGFGDVRTPAGALVTELARPGASPCRDRIALPGADLDLELRRGRLSGRLLRFGVAASQGARTRCPGGDAALGGPEAIATGSVPLRALRGRRITLRLSQGGAGIAQPFRVTTRPDVTIVMRRTRIVERFE